MMRRVRVVNGLRLSQARASPVLIATFVKSVAQSEDQSPVSLKAMVFFADIVGASFLGWLGLLWCYEQGIRIFCGLMAQQPPKVKRTAAYTETESSVVPSVNSSSKVSCYKAQNVYFISMRGCCTLRFQTSHDRTTKASYQERNLTFDLF